MKRSMDYVSKMAIYSSFIISNFSKSSLNKLENIQKRTMILYLITQNEGMFPLMRSDSGAVAAGRTGFWGFSVFMLCVSTMAVRWRCGGGGVRGGSAEWVLEPFFRSALRSGSGLETIGINCLEVLKPLY